MRVDCAAGGTGRVDAISRWAVKIPAARGRSGYILGGDAANTIVRSPVDFSLRGYDPGT